MTRIVKLAAAAIGTAGALAGAALLHPRSRRVARPTGAVTATITDLSGAGDQRPRRRRAADDSLLGMVRSVLAQDFGSASEGVTVRVQHGVVTLRGEVDHIDDIAVYEAVVRDVPGVADVDNLLRLRSPASRPRVLSA